VLSAARLRQVIAFSALDALRIESESAQRARNGYGLETRGSGGRGREQRNIVRISSVSYAHIRMLEQAGSVAPENINSISASG